MVVWWYGGVEVIVMRRCVVSLKPMYSGTTSSCCSYHMKADQIKLREKSPNAEYICGRDCDWQVSNGPA